MLKATFLFLILFSMHISANAQSNSMKGQIVGDLPKTIEVTTETGEQQRYNYAPMGGPTNYITIRPTFLKVVGDLMSMCTPRLLGKLNSPMAFEVIEDKTSVHYQVTIPAGAKVSSTCPDTSREASDLTFTRDQNVKIQILK